MGKLADIERLRLRATYFNNLSVALSMGGVLLPLLVVVQNAGSILNDLSDGKFESFRDVAEAGGTIAAMIVAFYGATVMQRHVRDTIAKIDDVPADGDENSD